MESKLLPLVRRAKGEGKGKGILGDSGLEKRFRRRSLRDLVVGMKAGRTLSSGGLKGWGRCVMIKAGQDTLIEIERDKTKHVQLSGASMSK